jgi:hypothetical protein
MIKKAVSIVLLICYVTVTVGFAMDMHFCGSKISRVSFNSNEKVSCGKTITPMKCCHSTHIDAKITDTHQAASNTITFKPLSLELFSTPFHPILISSPSVIRGNLFGYREPPLRSDIRLTIANSIFRI